VKRYPVRFDRQIVEVKDGAKHVINTTSYATVEAKNRNEAWDRALDVYRKRDDSKIVGISVYEPRR
jgi:hypothetical protein